MKQERKAALALAATLLIGLVALFSCQSDSIQPGSDFQVGQVPAPGQKIRLLVENLPRRGDHLWMGYVAIVTRTLEESNGIMKVSFEPDSETFLVNARDGFRFEDASKQVRSAGRSHDQRLGLKGTPGWTLKVVGGE